MRTDHLLLCSLGRGVPPFASEQMLICSSIEIMRIVFTYDAKRADRS